MLTDTERLNIRLLQTHKIALQNLAKLDGEPMSVVLRGLIRDEAQKRGVWPTAPTMPSREPQAVTHE